MTRKDTFPLPRIDDLLDQLNGKRVFTTLDAKRGYWQIRVQEDSVEKTGFVTFDGLYLIQRHAVRLDESIVHLSATDAEDADWPE